MRVRALDANGDYTFGHGQANFLVDSPQMVAQNILTTLKLWEGEWFLDTTAGTPWAQDVLGTDTQNLYDVAIQGVVLSVPGVLSISNYSSALDKHSRHLSVSMTVSTRFGSTTIATTL